MSGIPPIGAGSVVAGGGLAGADISVPSAAIAPMQNAAFFDPPTRTVLLNADGTAQEMDPVDQEVVFDLSTPLGAIPEDPTRGLDWDAILTATDARRLQVAKDAVNRCLAARIGAGDVSIEAVSLDDKPKDGATFIQAIGLNVTYKNLRAPTNVTPTSQKSKLPSAPTRIG